MAYYKIEFSESARAKFSEIDKPVQRAIQKYFNRASLHLNPRAFGKPLQYTLYGLWRYRVGDYRIIVSIQDNKLLILVIDIDHRRKVYD